MSEDISQVLAAWAYGEGANVRRITGDDGREKVQIRICVDTFHGLLQLDCDGRPDGVKPHGREFYLDYYEDKRERALATGGRPEDFQLSRAQCKRLFEESTLVYHRYVLLLQMGDFGRVVRDTARNMRLFRFVHAYAGHPEDREHLECWWPYLLRLHFTALAMEQLSQSSLQGALDKLLTCRERLRELLPQENEVFRTEMKRSLEALAQMEKEIRARLPRSELDELEHAKAAAIKAQRYEEAARLRDKIERLRAPKQQVPETPANP